MTFEETSQLLRLIEIAWPRHTFSRETAGLYAAMLADLTCEEAVQAVEELICESRFPPTIADIRQHAFQNRDTFPPDPQRAWMLVCLRYGHSRGKGNKEITLNPVIIAALDAAGVDAHRLHTTDNRHWLKQAFTDIYSVMRNDALKWHNGEQRSLAAAKGTVTDGDARVGPHLGLDAPEPERLPLPAYAAHGGGDVRV